jgi:hypothetical protein
LGAVENAGAIEIGNVEFDFVRGESGGGAGG